MLTQNVSNKRREVPIIGADPEVVAEVDPVGSVDVVGNTVGSVGSSRVHCGSGASGS